MIGNIIFRQKKGGGEMKMNKTYFLYCIITLQTSFLARNRKRE